MTALKKVERASLAQQVFDQLSGNIVAGTMEPGTALPAERELAEILGVNRGAVREGLRALAQAGLIETRHGGGSRVLDFRRHAGLDLLDRLLFGADGRVNLPVARSIMEMRSALAPDIARLCAARAGEDTARTLGELVRAMDEARDDLAQLQDLGLAFWRAVVAGCGNIAYELALNTLEQTYIQLKELLRGAMAAELQDLASYQAIAAAIGDRDCATAESCARTLVGRGAAGIQLVLDALERNAR